MRELIRLLIVALLIIIAVNAVSIGSGYTDIGGFLTLLIVLVLLLHVLIWRRI